MNSAQMPESGLGRHDPCPLWTEVVMQRRNTPRNMQRFYRLSVQRDLFGATLLLREWGRMGRAGRLRHDVHPDLTAAQVALSRLVQQKMRRGYSIVDVHVT